MASGRAAVTGLTAVALAVVPLALGGCDPVVNIAGANFPAWLLCAIAGALLTAAIRPLLLASGLEPHLGPRPLIYPCLAVLLGCTVWLVFFNRI
jgi:YtcA family